MWRDGPALKEWFDAVKAKRERDMDPRNTDIEDPVDNEAARSLVVA
jgi:hypothetical protein